MIEKFGRAIFLCWTISMWARLLLSLVSNPLSVQGGHNYESDEPIFHDEFSPILTGLSSQLDEVDGSGSPVSQEPLDLTADTRFIDSDTTWELTGENVPVVHKESSLHRSSSKSNPRNAQYFSNCGSAQCHEPPLNVRSLIGPTLMRSDVATTDEELKDKLRQEKEDRQLVKKSHHSIAATYWACGTTYNWTNLGPDYHPRHIKTAICNSGCANGRYQCTPRRFNLQVLKRFSVSDSPTFQQENILLLPPELRSAWRLVDHEIDHCCECSSRPLT